jgi:uncharacterized protein (DUF58 family)
LSVRRAVWLSLLIYLLLLAGLAVLNGRLLVLVIPLAVYLGAALLYGPEPLDLRASRTVAADRVPQNAPVAVTLSVTNDGAHLEQVLIEDVLPPRLEVAAGQTRLLASLPPGATVELSYSVRAQRGIFDFEEVRVTASDRLSLFCRRATLPAPGHLAVLPTARRLRHVPIRTLRTHGSTGPVPARQGGSGIDFFGIREYQAGDPRRWINWRLSARHLNALFTNEFELERIADVGLILDARQRSDMRTSQGSLFEHAILATASLAETFLSDGNRVGLLIYGRVLDWTFPGYGKVQRERILRALARARTGDSLVFERFDYLPTRFFPAQSQIVLVSPLCRDDLPTLLRLRARGYQVLVVRPNPLSLDVEALGTGRAVELAARLMRVERGLLRRQLRQAGIRVVDWQVDQPFERAFHASLGRAPQWFRAVGLDR